MKRIVTIEYKPNRGERGEQGPPGPGTSLPLDSTNVRYAPDGRNLEQIITELLYVDVEILSFITPQLIFEIGQIITSLTFNWAINKAIASQTITGSQVVPPTLLASDRSKTVAFSNLGSNGTVTLTVDDGSGYPTVSRTLSLTFLKGVFLGVGILGTLDSAFINGLNKTLQETKVREGQVTIGAGLYGWFACPVSYGLPSFEVNGFSGGMTTPVIVSVTNPYGSTEDYYVARTINSNLGVTNIKAI